MYHLLFLLALLIGSPLLTSSASASTPKNNQHDRGMATSSDPGKGTVVQALNGATALRHAQDLSGAKTGMSTFHSMPARSANSNGTTNEEAQPQKK